MPDRQVMNARLQYPQIVSFNQDLARTANGRFQNTRRKAAEDVLAVEPWKTGGFDLLKGSARMNGHERVNPIGDFAIGIMDTQAAFCCDDELAVAEEAVPVVAKQRIGRIGRDIRLQTALSRSRFDCLCDHPLHAPLAAAARRIHGHPLSDQTRSFRPGFGIGSQFGQRCIVDVSGQTVVELSRLHRTWIE